MAHDNASWDDIFGANVWQMLNQDGILKRRWILQHGNYANLYFTNFPINRQFREMTLQKIFSDEEFPISLKQYFQQYPQELDYFKETFITTDTPPTSLVCTLIPYWNYTLQDLTSIFIVIMRHTYRIDHVVQHNFSDRSAFPKCDIKKRPKPTIAKGKNIGDCWVYRTELEDDIFDLEPFKKHENVVVLERGQYGNKHIFKPKGLKQWFDSKTKPVNPKTNNVLMQEEIEKCKLKFQENSYMTWDASLGGLANYGPIEEEFQKRGSMAVAFVSLLALGALLFLENSR